MTDTRIAVATLAMAGLAATALAMADLTDPQWSVRIAKINDLVDRACVWLGLLAVIWLAWSRPAVPVRAAPGPVAAAPQLGQVGRPGMMGV